jgi:hypothetical protein
MRLTMVMTMVKPAMQLKWESWIETAGLRQLYL